MGSNLKCEFICFSITCCFLPSPPSLGAHAVNSQFVSGQIKLSWGNKRDKECIVNISCYLTREISSFSRVEFILVCSKLCLPRSQECELQETLYFIDGIAEGWLGAEHSQFLVPPTTGRGCGEEGCSSSQGCSMENTVESFPRSWAWQGLTAQLKMEQAVSERGSHPESSGGF